ncbi:hypothetical protein ETAA8_52940 [Anatilimnocola aggregata]|uniref:DUF1573 domain-containing protein n=1 Tax=Anatilimnocola aggregata TaxID=2528021 RepID=A0A517YIZ0_9BACT|nr:DUF1573 domain-containing protein [Anatilimnocola aggregata]QDU30175.1 hypothetical protein ETAA8_52940 [Anatilimnocola aggregata]
MIRNYASTLSFTGKLAGKVTCAFLVAGLLLCGEVSAKDWAQKMFKISTHDFGHVARGAKTEFAFEIQNTYEEDVHIAEVRSSCGCTTPTVTKTTLKTWEKGAVIAAFNTRSFTGQRNSTLTVVIDKPFHAEVQLQVSGYIHTDVDFQPGSIAFGDVDQGTTVQQKVAVTFYGRNNWNITDVRSVNEFLEVELSDAVRGGGRTTYQMSVKLKDNAPAGYISDTLTLVTDDRTLATVPLTVEGKIVPPLTVSPSALFLGVLQPGQSVTKQLVVRARQPFKILAVRCDGEAFQFKTTDQARPVHLVPVTFTADENNGEIQQTIEIETDLKVGGKTTCLARGSIRGPLAPPGNQVNQANQNAARSIIQK